MALVWVAATAVHIYSIRYVYKSSVEVSYFTPALWAVAWTLFNRRTDFRLEIHPLAQRTLLFMPFLIALPGFLPPTAHLNFILLGGNATAYFGLYLMKRKDVFRLNMVVLGMTALMVEILRELARRTSWDFTEIPRLIPYGAAYLILAGVAFRSAKIGLPAAIAAGCVAAAICNRTDDAGHIGLQVCLGFLLLHSLGWRDQSELGAGTARKLVASIWVLHSFIWVGAHTQASIALPASIAGAVVSGYFFFVWVLGQPMPKILLWSSSATVCSAPARYVAQGATMVSMGMVLVAVSFGLFALGTYFALRREKCLAFIQPQPPSQPENEPPGE